MHHLYLQEINPLVFALLSFPFQSDGSRARLSRILSLCGMHSDGGVG